MRKFAILSIVLFSGFSAAVEAQEFFHSEASVSAIGAFTSGADGNGIHQGASYSGGVLANYRYLFTPHQGIEVNYGYTLDTQRYTNAIAPALGVHSSINEATASYVFRLPLGRITPYVSAGTGALVFNPDRTIAGTTSVASTQAKATFVYGAGLDYQITKRLVFRAGYRGLVYGAPDFGVRSLRTDSVAHLAEPVGGFAFRF